jgi:hypothetical protein
MSDWSSFGLAVLLVIISYTLTRIELHVRAIRRIYEARIATQV